MWYAGGKLVGDADFRSLAAGRGEFAILILERGAQGKGLGTRFATLLHALAFRALGLERIYVTILPQNVASRRLFARIGYAVDASAEARAYVDEELDVAMSLGKEAFERDHADAIAQVARRGGHAGLIPRYFPSKAAFRLSRNAVIPSR